MSRINGTLGYSENADALVARWRRVPFEQRHAEVKHLFPRTPAKVLDIGAGEGTDAIGFAALGYQVTAVEPTPELRRAAIQADIAIKVCWLDDSLPNLIAVRQLHTKFDLIFIGAVWMHLNSDERILGMGVIKSLLSYAGILILSLRHGPVPPGRIMFNVTVEETVELAVSYGLATLLSQQAEALQAESRAQGVTWTWLSFRNRSTPTCKNNDLGEISKHPQEDIACCCIRHMPPKPI